MAPKRPKGPFCQSCAMPMKSMPEAEARKPAEAVLPKLRRRSKA